MKYLLMTVEDDDEYVEFTGNRMYYFSELTHSAACTWSPRISKAHVFNSREEIAELKKEYKVVSGGTIISITDQQLFKARLKGI